MSNLIKTLILFFALQFCHAQNKSNYPSVIVVKKDTLVCFTTEQSKQMAVWNEQRKECVELRKVDNQKINELENVKLTQVGIISNLEYEISLHKKTIKDKDGLIQDCEEEKKSLKKEIIIQKTGKWIAIIGGIVLSTLCLTL
jgi:hypothetical protein